jgi:hypothetical protein
MAKEEINYFLKILSRARPLLRNIKRKTKADSGSFDWGVTTNKPICR